MRITVTARPSFADKAASFRKLADTGIYEGLGRLAQEARDTILGNLKDESPVYSGPDPRRQGGDLRDSIDSRQYAHYGGGITLNFIAQVPYAGFVIGGTQAHPIDPVNASVLVFYNSDGELVFAKHVEHPGTQPNPFHVRAWEGSRADVLDTLSRTGREMIAMVSD